ncbi:DUF2062 domain-containing protein [Mesobacillus subterraneus]|uniref:DUF2062 domain-containing protein n=1 Tax=Mesobacillus subterraneus TaxID=285983 RepID=UPI0020415F31|nr:DUF2062 domain-containing protein [Mesobacillus subterraneus]MCM3664993.1 DUF2062 domain-containing protein [Mesobacillus subterraneus]MCM3682080.1 DUF2062 domain-containing protein [Mesobacillus subterraneus]
MMNKNMRRLKFLLIKLFRIKGNAHNISLGFTLGFLIHFIPSFGLGPILSTASARLFKGNPVAGFISGVALIWLFPFLFYLNVVVGETLFPYGIFPSAAGMPHHGMSLDAGMHIGAAFFLGMVVNLLLFGMIVYYLIFTIIKKYRLNFLSLIKKWDVRK